jgi:glycosyltransferase involved in cell wall biosynthesis
MIGPQVSALIPVYNGEQYLGQAIRSVLAQDYGPVEIIVVDDGSQDASGEIARSFPGVRYVDQSNQGVAAARNRAVRLATSEFVAFLDQDDRWTQDKLSVQMQYLLAHPEIDLVFAHMRMWLDGQKLPSWAKPEWLHGSHPGTLPSTFLGRRSLFERFGYFRSEYETGSDTDWFVRAKLNGLSYAMLPQVLLERRIHGNNESRRTLNTKELLRVAQTSARLQRKLAAPEPIS